MAWHFYKANNAGPSSYHDQEIRRKALEEAARAVCHLCRGGVRIYPVGAPPRYVHSLVDYPDCQASAIRDLLARDESPDTNSHQPTGKP